MFVLTGFKEKRQKKEAAFSTEEVHFCDIGLLRKSNQDSVFVFQSPGFALFLIADGMGGHLHGEMAAQAVSGAFSDWCDHFCIEKFKENFDQILEEISLVIERINLRIYSEWNQDGICGTTLTLLAFFKRTLSCKFMIFFLSNPVFYLLLHIFTRLTYYTSHMLCCYALRLFFLQVAAAYNHHIFS